MRLGDLPILPDRASTAAEWVDGLALGLLAFCGLLALGIMVAILAFVVIYRHGSGADRSNAPTGNTLLELAWTLLPTVIGLAFFGWGAWEYFRIHSPPPGALQLFVVGKQWMWKVQHPEGRIEIDSLHVPVGRPVRLTMISEDAIHSFFLPDFRLKQDVLPGRYSNLWFEATKVGESHLFCAEFCGTDHSSMRGRVVVMEEADYQRWVGGAEVSLAEQGRALYESLGCVSCHGRDSSVPAPRLEGAWGNTVRMEDGTLAVVDEDYVRESILRPLEKVVAGYPRLMPTYEGRLTEEQVLALVAYVRSLEASP